MDINYILNEIHLLKGRELSNRIDQLAEFYGVARQSIWRSLNNAGVRKRAVRVDKGETKVTDDILNEIATRVNISKRLNGDFTNSVKKAVSDMIESGIIIPVGYARICTLLQMRNLDRKSLSLPTPHKQLISLYPNHVWQFDITNCLQWHLKNKGGLAERDVDRLFYKNKIVKEAKKIRQELLRFVIVDHCSGSFFFWYYYTSGERAEDGADFFYRAFQEKSSLIFKTLNVDYKGKYQIHGVPNILYSDKGSILRSKVMQNLFEALDVKIELHQAGNPRAKGMVEGLMRIIGNNFESNLKRMKIDNLEMLNKVALDWCINFNCNKVFRNNKHRTDLWLNIKDEELRIVPNEILFKTLQHKPAVTRKADGNRRISYDGRIYQCPDINAVKQRVIIKANAYEYPSIDIHYDGKVWTCKPLIADKYGRHITDDAVIFGDYKSLPLTKLEKSKQELELIAYEKWGVEYKGNKGKRQSIPPSNIGEYEVKTTQNNISAIRRKGVQSSTPNIHLPLTKEQKKYDVVPNPDDYRLIPINEILRQYVAEYGRITPIINSKIKSLYPAGVPISITLTDIHKMIDKDVNTKQLNA